MPCTTSEASTGAMSEHRPPHRAWPLPCVALLAVATATAAEPTYLEIIFDASGSMEQETERIQSRENKVTIARDEMRTFVAGLPRRPDFQVALRVFGTDREKKCEDTRLLRPFGPVDDAMLEAIGGVVPAPFGKTPIARSLSEALDDFQGLPTGAANRAVILITDGVETCEGDVDASVARIFGSAISLKVHIVGFDVLDWEDPTQKKLEAAARATGGEAVYPKGRDELQQDLRAIAKAESEPAAKTPTAPARTWADTLRENVILLVGASVALLALGAILVLRRPS